MRIRNLLALGALLVLSLPDRSVRAEDPLILPAPGVWKYSEFDASKNTCKSDEVVTNGNGTFVLTRKENGHLRIHAGDGTDAFDCFLTGPEFECPDRAAASYDLRKTGVDAVLHGKGVAKGSFMADEHMTGQQIITFTCEGSACAMAAMAVGASFPCEVVIDFEAKLKSKK